VTCSFSGFVFLLGGESPPSILIAFPLVTALQAFQGVFAALVLFYIIPGQSLFMEKVELGGIEPPSIRQ
jgi:hypothetical protein